MAFDKANKDKHLDKAVREMIAQAGKDGVLPITQMGEPVLRRVTDEYVGQLDERTLKNLIKAMRTTMLEAPGVGIAGPQVGLSLAIAVVEDHKRKDDEDDPRDIQNFPFHAIINPKYEPVGDATASYYEGCLSFEGYQAVRKRWLEIDATWQDEQAQWHTERLHGWPARIFQHETDHLSGEVYIDKAEIRSLANDDNLSYYWCDDPVPTHAAEVLGFEL